MKNSITALLLVLTVFGCKKDDDGNKQPVDNGSAFEQRLVGDWDLQAVKYDAEVPNPFNPGSTIPIQGNATAVSGGHTVTRKPNEIDYTYNFTASIDFNGIPIPFPVARQGLGEWTLSQNEDRIFITEEEETVVWKVLVNETDKQVYEGTVLQEFSGVIVAIDTELTFVR